MALSCSTPEDVTKALADNNVEIVDVKFTDLFGQWQHFSMPVEEFDIDDALDQGMGFDGSSIRGFQTIENSDMVLKPDVTTAFMDPATAHATLSLICNVYDPLSGEAYSRDPRNIVGKAESYLQSTGMADTVYCGPEAEFFVFDEVSYLSSQTAAGYAVSSGEGIEASAEGGLGHQMDFLRGYYPVSPFDTLQDIRSDMVRTMIDAGIVVEVHHHEVASNGQCEIDMKYAPMLTMADQVQMYKYIVKNVAKNHGKSATFMPKPIFADNGSGMHTHISLWKDGNPLFAGDQYAGLSEMAMYFAGGIIKHIDSLLAFAAPLTNSYRRLVPGYEAPVIAAISARNRSAAIRIPMYSHNPKAKRIEFRCPDPGANPYLAFSALLMAGLDGIDNKISPGDPAEKDLFEHENMSKYAMVKGSLGEVLDALEADNDYLLKGGVFTPDLIETYVAHKRVEDVDAVRLRPHPHEFVMYYGI